MCDGVIFTQHQFTLQRPFGGKQKRPPRLLIRKVFELLFPREPQHGVDVDQAQKIGFKLTGHLDCGSGTIFIDLFHRPVGENEGLLLEIYWAFWLPIMDDPVSHCDHTEGDAGGSQLSCVAKSDTKNPRERDQDGWHPVDQLNRAELIGDVLAYEEQGPSKDYSKPDCFFDRLQSTTSAHLVLTGMGRILGSARPSSSPAG